MNFDAFVEDYCRNFVDVINSFDQPPMPAVLEIFSNVSAAGGTIWVAGNGGNAAISDHAVGDVTKLTRHEGRPSVSFVINKIPDVPKIIRAKRGSRDD